MAFHVPHKYRVRNTRYGTDDSFGNNGMFRLMLPRNQVLRVIASDGMGWEHVSVSRTDRCPLWDEMQWVKGIFWDDTDLVVQYHVPSSEHINNHAYCLHLWRPVGVVIPQPPLIMV